MTFHGLKTSLRNLLMALKRTKLDAVISNLVRERAEWKCEKCGKYYPEGRRQGLHCSHYMGRRHAATRHYGGNCFAHCFSCHQHLSECPHYFTAWVKDRLGDVRYEELVQRHNRIVKRTNAERDEMYKHFKAQLKYLQRRRAKGERGYIDFVEWD